MEKVLVGRQPIYRKDMGVLGYELLFRDSEQNRASFSDGDQATTEVILNTFMNIGLEETVGQNLAFINFGRNLLLGNYCDFIPKHRVVLEILETVDSDEPVLQRLDQLKDKGYRIALDDFVYGDRSHPLLEAAAFVKLDVMASDWQRIEETIATLKSFPVQLIAEKVETREQFQICQKLGFDYFQGYFFCRPSIIKGQKLPVNRLATIRLITKLNNPDIEMKELEEAISQDVSLSYKLLRYANSSVCGLAREVESLRHAAILIGLEKMRIWASLILFSGLEDKPRDVIVTGAVRARMCEKLAEALKMKRPDRFFLVGLFSVLDAILDRPLNEIVETLPLSSDVVEALLRHEGELGSVLRYVLAYERHDESAPGESAPLDPETIGQTYVEALAWSLRSLNGFPARTAPTTRVNNN